MPFNASITAPPPLACSMSGKTQVDNNKTLTRTTNKPAIKNSTQFSMKSLDFLQAQSNLAKAMRDVNVDGEPLLIDGLGEHQAVLLSRSEYQHLLTSQHGPKTGTKSKRSK